LFLGCKDNQNKNNRYTDEQIASLRLDSAKTLDVACDSLTKIDLNPYLKKQSFDFGSLVEEIKFLPLETTVEESLLDRINKVVISESNIYIYDDFKGGGIVVFTRDGEFLKRLSNGRGPGELDRLYDIDFDKENNELVAYKHSFLMFFTPEGKYIRQEKLPFGFNEFEVIPNGYVFRKLDRQLEWHLGNLGSFTLLVTNKKFEIIYGGLPFSPGQNTLEGRKYLHNNNELHISQRFNDTIYQYVYKPAKLKAKYALEYNKHIPKKILTQPRDVFGSVAKKNDYYFYLGDYLESGHHHFFLLENWHTGKQALIYRDIDSGNIKGGTDALFNLSEIPPIAFPTTTFGSYFISLYYPGDNALFATKSSIISEDDKKRVEDLTDNDNPVMVFFKLKEF
jgi:hypothetical protein